jgi:RNA polymerase sigma-70 factor (ECF subfamily)
MVNDSSGGDLESLGSTSSRLIQGVKTDGTDAWYSLVKLYGPLVLYWCRQAGLQGPDRDDVFQEVFRAVAKGIKDFRHDRPSDTFRGWLRTVTRSKLNEYLRQQAREPAAAGGSQAYQRILAINDGQASALGDAEDLAESSVLVRQAMRLIRSQFEDRTWRVFLRAAVDGLPSDVVAKESGTTPEGVRQAKSRVLRRLRDELRDSIG